VAWPVRKYNRDLIPVFSDIEPSPLTTGPWNVSAFMHMLNRSEASSIKHSVDTKKSSVATW
jgi:hypothetical protein